MTEAEWLACTNLEMLLEYLTHKPRQAWLNRRLRLFGCACCRRIWHLLPEKPYRPAVEVAERFEDGLASRDELEAAQKSLTHVEAPTNIRGQEIWKAVAHVMVPPLKHNVPFAARHARFAAYGAVAALTGRHATYGGGGGGWDRWTQLRWGRAAKAERGQQLLYLRDVVGNPFRKVKAQPAWLTWNRRTIPNLAQAAYDERQLPSGKLDPARLAVLADALEEVGCQAANILSHCRGPGPHVRGCWVMDLLLSKGR